MLDVQQQWTEATTDTSVSRSGPVTSTTDSVDNEVTGGNGIWTALETIASAGASPSILAVGFVQSATPKYTTETVAGPTGTSGYTHLMVGSVYVPTNVYGAETILEDEFVATPLPLAGTATASPDPIDVGGTFTLTALAHGGSGVYTFAWSGLPVGCLATSSSVVSCRPTGPGVSFPVATFRDTAGDVVTSAPAVVVVNPSLNVSVVPSSAGADAGGPLTFSAAISGGTAPYACTWTLPGQFPTPGNCTGPVAVATGSADSVTAEVSVADATGAVVNASSVAVPVHNALILSLAATNTTALVVGTPATFAVTVLGGTFPVSLSWYEGAARLAGDNGTSITVIPATAGNITISVQATDAAGGSAT
ncbi:MAG: hypothetical protein L3J81_04200, partial [Thermoplasmata archaeon]|nr:hypothetical protein [Thermoplasmata archaeon]